MKHFLTLSAVCLLLLNCAVNGQQDGKLFLTENILKGYEYSYELDQHSLGLLYPERFSNTGWKFHAGDDMMWKDATFNDSKWVISNTDFNYRNTTPEGWKGIGWFRLRLTIDSPLLNKPLALVIIHFGASELYVDGKLMNQFGIPSQDPAIEKIFHPFFCKPIVLNLGDKREHLLAIRYSFLSSQAFYSKYGRIANTLLGGDAMGFYVHFGEAKKAVDLYGESLTRNLTVAMITLGALILIGAFHLFLYRYYTRDRSNLYVALYSLVLGTHTLSKFLPTYARMDFGWMIENSIINVLMGVLWVPAMFIFYYSIVYSRLPKYVWLYALWMPLYALIQVIDYHWEIGFCLMVIFLLDAVRLLIKSFKLKQRPAWVMGLGVVIGQAALTLWFFPLELQSILPIEITKVVIIYVIFLAVPIAMTVYNALASAKTSLELENQLSEVKRLSVRSLAQEQEKQQILFKQKEVLEHLVLERTTELRHSIENLRSTQSQLVHAEKMASLGELTAGIAHEIQNPLNFVNNFSEINRDLIVEAFQAQERGDMDEVAVLLGDIRDNEGKIHQHGLRADAIVKSMLQHSRASSGKKEPTDLAALADEYLKLAYHGMRAKDKDFNCTLETDFDPDLPKVNVVTQDIGRVLLNLYNNAFQAVMERKKSGEVGYEPKVRVEIRGAAVDPRSSILDPRSSIRHTPRDGQRPRHSRRHSG